MLVVLFGVIGVVVVIWMWGLENDVYFQVGLLIIIGLLVKNVILIVEFVSELNNKGKDLVEVIFEVFCLWLWFILMIFLVFIFGVLFMVIS